MDQQEELRLFGQTIRSERSKLSLSQETLASQSGLHRTYISLLERGLRNPSLTVIMRIASALGISASTLVAAFEAQHK